MSDERTAPTRRTRLIGLVIAVMIAIWLAGDGPGPPVAYAPLLHPFRNADLFVDHSTAAAKWQAANGATWLDRITHNPQARWLNQPKDLDDLPAIARLAGQRDELLVLTAYYIPNRDCGGASSGAPSDSDYEAFVDGLIRALGPVHAAIVVEPDAVAAACFDHHRAALLKQTVQRLAGAGHFVYLDAGHPGWRSTADMAKRLLESGIASAEGFSVNVANRQTTKDCYAWARALSRRLGGREFVIDTSRNGLGPPTGAQASHSSWCNAERQALGEDPTTPSDRPGLAALLWIKPPGESDGPCGAGQTDLGFSPDQAESLIRSAPHR